jgi:hypothetical protein
MNDVIETLLRVEEDDAERIEVEVDGKTLPLYVVEAFRREVEYYDGIPHKGVLRIETELDGDVEDYDIPTHSVTLRATEPKPGNWYGFETTVWDPVVNEETEIVRDEYNDLGKPTNVEVKE